MQWCHPLQRMTTCRRQTTPFIGCGCEAPPNLTWCGRSFNRTTLPITSPFLFAEKSAYLRWQAPHSRTPVPLRESGCRNTRAITFSKTQRQRDGLRRHLMHCAHSTYLMQRKCNVRVGHTKLAMQYIRHVRQHLSADSGSCLAIHQLPGTGKLLRLIF